MKLLLGTVENIHHRFQQQSPVLNQARKLYSSWFQRHIPWDSPKRSAQPLRLAHPLAMA